MKKIYDSLVKHIVENQNQFYRAAYSYVKNREAALDVVQNAICKGLENYEKLQCEEAMASWFYRILINESLMYLRKEKKYIAWDESDNDLLEGSFEEPAYEPKIEVVSKVSDLPTDMQVVIQLHFFEEKTLKEIAEITGTNLNTVKSRLYAACKKLGKELEKEDEELITRHSKSLEKTSGTKSHQNTRKTQTKLISFASSKQKAERAADKNNRQRSVSDQQTKTSSEKVKGNQMKKKHTGEEGTL